MVQHRTTEAIAFLLDTLTCPSESRNVLALPLMKMSLESRTNVRMTPYAVGSATDTTISVNNVQRKCC